MAKRRDRWVVLALFALLFSVYLFTQSGVYHSSDEMSMLAVTDSLARRGAWDIELLRWMGEQQGSFGPDGHLYSRKGIGTTLAALPAYWLASQSELVGNVQAAMVTNAVITALTGVLVYLLLRRLRYRLGAALFAALSFGLATMAWPYARYLFSESLAGLGLLASTYWLVRYGTVVDGEQPTLANLLLAGLGLGVALLARLNNAIVAPFLGLLLLFYLYRRHGRNWRAWLVALLLFGLPVLASLTIVGWYNWLRFGSPLITGYLSEERFATPFFEGLYGLTLSPGKGLLWYNPLLFAALAAAPAFFRKHRAEALLVAGVVLVNVAFYAPWYLWWAGHGWGPRFLVTMLPFAVLPLAAALEAVRDRRWLAIGLDLLVFVSIAIQVLGVAVDFNLYLEDVYAALGLYHPATLFDVAYSPLIRQIEYVDLQHLDLAWARGGVIVWDGLIAGLGLILGSGLGLILTLRLGRGKVRRLSGWIAGGILLVLAMGSLFLLMSYAPRGDVAQAAQALGVMEQPGEAAALTEAWHTEPFQDAYDGSLWVWGVAAKEQVQAGQSSTWAVGAGDPDPASARFQVGDIRLDYFPPAGTEFYAGRLPVTEAGTGAQLDAVVELVAAQVGESSVRVGDTLPVALYWRALAPPPASYTVFVQVIDASNSKAAQVDRMPCHGQCPTNTWRTGDLVGERYDLSLDPGASLGRYQIIAGMYDLATGENLSHVDEQGNVIGGYIVVDSVYVQP
ncbi:MAG: hypothetical protein PVF67_10020 [Anaerolineae bacterium]